MEVAAAVIGVADVIARTSSGVWTLCGQWSDAPRELHLLRDGLVRAGRLFEEIESTFADNKETSEAIRIARPDSVSSLLGVLRLSTSIAEDLKVCIEGLIRQRPSSGQSAQLVPRKVMANRRRLEWLAKRSRILKNHKALTDVMAEVCLLLTSLNMTVTTELTTELRNVDNRLYDAIYSTAEDTQLYIDKRLQATEVRVLSQMSLELSRIQQPAIAEKLPDHFPPSPNKLLKKKGAASQMVWPPTPTFMSCQCASGCDCLCHKHRTRATWTINSPRGIGGEFQISYNVRPSSYGKSAADSCTNTQCMGSRSWIRLNYRFPEWLLRVTLSVFYTGTVSRPEMILRVSQRVPAEMEKSSIFFSILSADLDRVRRSILDRPQSVHDIFDNPSVCFECGPLYVAVQYGLVSIARLLTQAGSEPLGNNACLEDFAWSTPIHAAFRRVLSGKPGSQVWAELFDLSGLAEQLGYSDLSKIISGFLPLDPVAAVTNPAFSQQIQQPGLDGLLPIHLAAIKGDTATVEALLEAGVDPDVPTRSSNGITPLRLTCMFGWPGTARSLLEAGADPGRQGMREHDVLPLCSIRDRDGALPLMRALVEHGADVNKRNADDMGTPLSVALYIDHAPCVEFLLARGANPDFVDIYGNPAMFGGIECNSCASVSLLLRYDANYRFINHLGWGVLHFLAWAADVDIMRLFTAHAMTGLDVKLKTDDEKTAEDLFRERHNATPELRRAFHELLQSLEYGGQRRTQEGFSEPADENGSNDEFYDALDG